MTLHKGNRGDTARERPTVTYFISHCHKRDKSNAIATLSEVMRRLGYTFPVADCRRVFPDAEVQILMGGSLMRATINIYDPNHSPIASEDELPYLDVTFSG